MHTEQNAIQVAVKPVYTIIYEGFEVVFKSVYISWN
jgi:hypothetical protein